MKRNTKIFALLLLVVGCTTAAFGWGNATHTYIAKQVTVNGSTFDFRVAYAANLPDMCNLIMTNEGQSLAGQMHQTIPTLDPSLMNCDAQAILYGIIIHGEVYGADYTAHIQETPQSKSWNAKTGYFVIKGQQLAASGLGALVYGILKSGTPSRDNQEVAWGIAAILGHDLCETAVDLLVKENLDNTVGLEMIAAAEARAEDVPQLLAAAYSQDLAYITPIENAFREQMENYGGAMTLPIADAIQVLAAVQAPVAKMYIEALLMQQGLPTTVDVSPELVANSMTMALGLVKDGYKGELNKTIAFIRHNPISNCPVLAKQSADQHAESSLMHVAPKIFALEGNYPNPFNPTTTIRYSLPQATHVRLTVYNALGQQVAELVNGDVDAGGHSVQFNAANLASGIYFCRLQAGAIADTKKLVLAK